MRFAGRRIAYIMYFVPPWTAEDGGSLDLFDRDTKGCPKSIVKSLIPAMNTMVCFEVTPKSFHQVSEVFTKDKTRLSIGGWFHGATVPRPPKYIEPSFILQSPISISEGKFKYHTAIKMRHVFDLQVIFCETKDGRISIVSNR